MPADTIKVLDHGFVKLLNIAGPLPRDEETYRDFDGSDTDPSKVARISLNNFEEGRSEEADLKLYEYLVANGHNTPVEMIETWWHMQMPIFIARQFVRHRTAAINEVSARYAILPDKWYIPEAINVGIKGSSNKQGRLMEWEKLEEKQQWRIEDFCSSLNTQCKQSYELYSFYLGEGIAPELARSFLHTNHYTHWVWKMDLHNLLHFLSLRCHEHAQWEAQQYGNAIYEILKQFLPKSMELFDIYRRKATSQELVHLSDALAVLEHYKTGMDYPEEGMETVKKFFKRLGVK